MIFIKIFNNLLVDEIPDNLIIILSILKLNDFLNYYFIIDNIYVKLINNMNPYNNIIAFIINKLHILK